MTLERVHNREICLLEKGWEGFLLGFRMGRIRVLFPNGGNAVVG